jgi:sulfatase maturation enzyme AslB (radical SAM superfamily)
VAPYIYNLKLIGGEPLVMKKFYTLLSKIIHKDEARAMMIKYQTNMSVLEFEKIKITKFIPHFHLFEFTVSLDGIEKENNYIRRRSNWEEIIRNMEHVSFYPNVEININGTISFLSVLRFYRLINWAKENGDLIKQINWSNIRGPAKLCANVLPQKLKDKLIPMYEGFPDIQNVLKEDNHGHHYQETLDYLFMIDKHYKGTKWEMNLFDVYPELEEFYKPHIQEIEL